MSITVPMPAPGIPPGSDRLVTTRINGVAIALPCFEWCTLNHHARDERFFEDVDHLSEAVTVSSPCGDGSHIFTAQVIAAPHCQTGTRVVVDYDNHSDELDAEQAEALADEFISAASRIRGLARIAGGAR